MQCTAAARPGALQPAAAAAPTPTHRRGAALRVAADKGFSGAGGQKLPKQVKKSKRGKVASRPSPKLTLEQLEAEQAAYEQGLRQQRAAAAAAAESEDAEEAAADAYLGSSSSTVQYGSSTAVPEAVTDRMLKVRRAAAVGCMCGAAVGKLACPSGCSLACPVLSAEAAQPRAAAGVRRKRGCCLWHAPPRGARH